MFVWVANPTDAFIDWRGYGPIRPILLLASLVVSVTSVSCRRQLGGGAKGQACNQGSGVQAGWGTTTRAAQAWRGQEAQRKARMWAQGYGGH